MDDQDKTDWYDPDQEPVRNGLYEFDRPERFFQGRIWAMWRTHHWVIEWDNGVTNGKIVTVEPPCRWRGYALPPADSLLEI